MARNNSYYYYHHYYHPLLFLLVAVAAALPFCHSFAATTTTTTTTSPTSNSYFPLSSSSATAPTSLVRQSLITVRQHPPLRVRKHTTILHDTTTSSSSVPKHDDPTEHGGTSTSTASIFNLVKGIVGAGVLSLPAGVASFCNAPSGIIPAVALISLIGATSGYCFYLIGRVCAYTGAESYREAWTKSVGESTSLIPAVSVTLKTMCAVLAYSMILADTFTSLFATMGMGSIMTRTKTLYAITCLILLPLCWLKNLSSLAPFSLVGTLGMVFTTVCMGIRYFQKAYSLTAATKFPLVSPELAPKFGTVGMSGALTPNVFILICMLSTAFMAHFNAPKFYTELKNNTLERFSQVVSTSFGISISIFSLITTLGYLTFGAASDGLILNNYSTKDTLMSFARVAVALSLVFSYPLAFVGVKEGLLDLVAIQNRTDTVYNTVTVTTLAAITYAALKVTDVSFVLAFAGATLGNALIYVFPTIMFRGTVGKMTNASAKLKREAKLAPLIAAAGIVMGAIGGSMAIKSLG